MALFLKGQWLNVRTHYVYTTTNSLEACLIKFSVLSVTLFVSIVCAFLSKDGGKSTFYVTVLLQSINTAYDELNFLGNTDVLVHKRLKILTIIVFIFQVILIASSISYLCGAIFFDKQFVTYVMIFLVASPVLLLIFEIFVHITISDK